MFLRASHFAAVMALLDGSSAREWLSPEYRFFYQFPLPIPPVKRPKMSINNPVTNTPIDYYEVDILPFKKQIYPDRGLTSMVGYDGMSPGPTFLVPRGREAVVRFTNKAVLPSAVHLHGSPTRAPWDGWAEDRIFPGQYKDYYYPNSESARFLWYHDHAMEITAVNSYFGQAGAYIVEDVAEEKLGLPSGYGVYDIPLILTSKRYGSDGALTSPAGEIENLFGDVVHVNGQPWPFFQVEPRKYRLRFLNAAVSRSFILYFQQEFGPGVPYQEAGPGAPFPGGGPGVPSPGGGPGVPFHDGGAGVPNPGSGPGVPFHDGGAGAPFPGGGPGVPYPGGGPGVPFPGGGPGAPYPGGGPGVPFPGGGPGAPYPGGGPGAPFPGGGPGVPSPGGGPGVPFHDGGAGVPNPGSGPGVPFHDGGAGIPFQVVASDSGLLAGPVPANMLAIANAERWEVVFDFSPFAGQNLTLMNQLEVGQDKDYAPTDQVMRFVVGPGAVADTSVVPVRLRDVPFPPPKGDVVDRRFLFHQQNGLWKINGVGFSDVQNRVLAKVPRGTVEIWEFENGGGGVHPIHVHLVDFRILSRVGAGRSVLPHEAAGLKDVVWLGPGEVVRVEAHYAPWDGVYMFHCHNMIHEDHEMMAAFNVSSLADLGYKEASFADPMDPKWRAVPVSPVAFSNDAVVQKVQAMAALQPYNIGGEVWRKIAQRWSA